MNCRVGAAFLLAPYVLVAAPVMAAQLPPIKATIANPVPACATPGRLDAFLKSRNPKLADKFETIAVEYMRHGEALGLRWDIAFFQMLVETGNLTFHGDVDIKQNNFAGLGATGHHESGETFKDVTTGARAHLEHVLMYSGAKIDNPVAERTRKVQEWGVLTSWQKSINGPMTYQQLAQQWAPKSRRYARDIESVADSFYDGACKEPDPRPELVAMARGDKPVGGVEVDYSDASQATPAKTGAEIARRSIEEARAEDTPRSSLGATALAKAGAATLASDGQPSAEAAAKPAPAAFKLLNPAKPEGEAAGAKSAVQTPPPATTATAPGDKPATVQTASAAQTAHALSPAPAAVVKTKCNVFTASYGGQKAIIIKASAPDAVNYTVLDVNEGAEKREAEAYIAAYAKGGEKVAEFDTSEKALNKAFELCPEG